ncbi:PAS domain-containing protein, partial [Burkholderia vietnamiensis]|uniref:PAS domain-containing protein n=1 Tax=Burkholderia vietnamiensis TaxID=60552 RepID=UPI00158D9E60
PVILYRLRGVPSFPLIYISHDIARFGHDRATLLASPVWANELVAQDDQARVDAALARILDKDTEGVSIEFRLRTGDGAYRCVENRYVPVRDKDGRLIEVEGIIIDIAERKVAEENIARLAHTDALTGLANRAGFLPRVRQA